MSNNAQLMNYLNDLYLNRRYLSKVDAMIMEPIFNLFKSRLTTDCFDEKQIEIITSMHNEYFEARNE